LGTSRERLRDVGLSFKPNTNDLRDAPALTIARELIKQGATVRAYDPAALEEACQMVSGLVPCTDAYETAQGADALILMTEWNQFRTLDFDRLKTLLRKPIFFDLRNVYDPDRVAGLASVIFRSEGRVKPLHQPPNWSLRESRCFDLDLIFDFRLVAHPVQHLHHPRLQTVVGLGERRGQRLDGGLSDFTIFRSRIV
jgi:Predicted UDP-glucose 6-dehydrogenase